MNRVSRIAVVGVGSMGMRHAKIYQTLSHATLCAVVDINHDHRSHAENVLGIPGYQTVQAMMANERVDGVSICIPAKLHKPIVTDCFNHNLSVLLEKPFAASVSEAQQILQAAKNRLLLIGHVERFNPAIAVLKEQIIKKTVGEIVECRINRNGVLPNQTCQAVGVHFDLTIHDLDLLQYIFNAQPSIINIQHFSRNQVSALLSVNNIEVQLLTQWGNIQKRTFKIVGTRGHLDINLLDQQVTLSTLETIAEIPVPAQNALALQLQHFIGCMQDRENPRITPIEALQAVELAAKLEPLVRT
jgi:UDP-N-acetylglucosamine 3-dehydrogenase